MALLQSIAAGAGLHAGGFDLELSPAVQANILYPLGLKNVPPPCFKNTFVMSNISGQSTATDFYPQELCGSGVGGDVISEWL